MGTVCTSMYALSVSLCRAPKTELAAQREHLASSRRANRILAVIGTTSTPLLVRPAPPHPPDSILPNFVRMIDRTQTGDRPTTAVPRRTPADAADEVGRRQRHPHQQLDNRRPCFNTIPEAERRTAAVGAAGTGGGAAAAAAAAEATVRSGKRTRQQRRRPHRRRRTARAGHRMAARERAMPPAAAAAAAAVVVVLAGRRLLLRRGTASAGAAVGCTRVCSRASSSRRRGRPTRAPRGGPCCHP